MTTPGDDDIHEPVLAMLVDAYGLLWQGRCNALTVEECAQDAPWNRSRELTEMGTPGDVLISFGENAAVLAAQAVRRHLGTLLRLYGPDPAMPDGGPDSDRWPHAAAYAPARAIAEGTALVGWLLDPDPKIGRAVRILRAAQFGLWSSAKRWRKMIEEAGHEVRSDERSTPMVWMDEGSRPLSVGSLVRTVHGKRADSKTNKWSKLLHDDPDVLAPLATQAAAGEGAYIGSQIREDQHLDLALDLTGLLRSAGERQAAYWGRAAADLPESCDRVTATRP